MTIVCINFLSSTTSGCSQLSLTTARTATLIIKYALFRPASHRDKLKKNAGEWRLRSSENWGNIHALSTLKSCIRRCERGIQADAHENEWTMINTDRCAVRLATGRENRSVLSGDRCLFVRWTRSDRSADSVAPAHNVRHHYRHYDACNDQTRTDHSHILQEKNSKIWQVTYLSRPPTLRYPYQSCHVGWGPGRS